MSNLEPREELASIAASLRAYLEWQLDCGSSGIPRRPRAATAAVPPAQAAATPSAASAATSAKDEPSDPSPAAPSPIVRERSTPGGAPAAPPPGSLPPITLTESAPAPSKRSESATPAPRTIAEPRPLPVLVSDVASCTKCGLHATRTNTVFSRGNPEAKLCFVGEAPGADEDAQGVPFVGRAGQLLDKMIQAMGLDPAKDVYVCNIIKCRPPENRRPEPDEIATCIPYLHEQLALVEPKVIVALGNTSVGALLGTKLGITKVRGSWKLYRGKIPVMPTYHPSYLLRSSPQQSEAKRQAWEDLQAVMKELGLAKPARS
ncbi:MAG: uracil-DNA glycosylase [Labilithrix sp.]|nr:uracil-DNA glycosylase [Labilithrix sp.]MBX3219639.1 uracil-DNA glycosylase [Labilithrix sp.]